MTIKDIKAKIDRKLTVDESYVLSLEDSDGEQPTLYLDPADLDSTDPDGALLVLWTSIGLGNKLREAQAEHAKTYFPSNVCLIVIFFSLLGTVVTGAAGRISPVFAGALAVALAAGLCLAYVGEVRRKSCVRIAERKRAFDEKHSEDLEHAVSEAIYRHFADEDPWHLREYGAVAIPLSTLAVLVPLDATPQGASLEEENPISVRPLSASRGEAADGETEGM